MHGVRANVILSAPSSDKTSFTTAISTRQSTFFACRMRDKLRNWLLALFLISASVPSWAQPEEAIPEAKAEFLVVATLQSPVDAPPAPRIAPSGLPVPRWVSVRAGRVNVRRGPSLDQDVVWTYVRAGVPVEIIAEYDTWRRIRDASGDTGWVKAAISPTQASSFVWVLSAGAVVRSLIRLSLFGLFEADHIRIGFLVADLQGHFCVLAV